MFYFIPFVGRAIGFMIYIAIIVAALAFGCFGSVRCSDGTVMVHCW